MRRISCKNCGKEVNIDNYSTFFYCTACGQKNEISIDLEENQIKYNNDKYIKLKANLHKAYIGRNITDIMENCQKVLEICPNDFFADFLLSYCYFKKGNNLRLKNFLINFTYNDVTEQELEIILSEITKDNLLYEEKYKFIIKLSDYGVNVDKYLAYYHKEKKEKEKPSIFDKLFKLVNNLSLIISICIMLILGLIIDNDVFEIYIFISIVVLIVNNIIINKNNYSIIQVIFTIFFSFAIYVCVRLLLSALINKSYQDYREINFKKIFYGGVKK